ncbi:MAG: DegT/DnrJ/EryC1/StrS family aminotransferase [Deltaproteobacteria bacterium]|nr:DegT/DnrJ/EryC1/StrS family aminotransferase [Deltaproteobacteria bacterium]
MTMPSGARTNTELPPTAGLPLTFGDYARRPVLPFAEALRRWPNLPEPAVACSGTAALAVALKTLRRRAPERDTVIVPAFTCPLVPLAAALVPGVRVAVCDTLPGGIDLDPQALDALCGEKTLAVVPTHLGGRVANLQTAAAVAARCGAYVIEDAAQALGAFAENGRSVGLEGDIGFFSLAAGKGLTTYEGGILVSRDARLRAELSATARETLRPSLFWTLRRNLELLGYALLYNPSGLRLAYGRNLRRKLADGDEAGAVGDRFSPADIPLHSLDALRLRVAANALARLPAFLAEGRARAARRIDQLAGLTERAGVSLILDRPGADGIWPFFMVLLPSKDQRDRALHRLWRAGLGVSKLFVSALPDYDFLAPFLKGKKKSDCPNARDLAGRMLTVSNTHWMDDDAFTRIAETLERSL